MIWPFRRRALSREIFSFSDGSRTRYVDPVLVWQKLDGEQKEWIDLLRILSKKDDAGVDMMLIGGGQSIKIKEDAAKRLAEIICTAFGVAALDDAGGKVKGLTITQRIRLATDYFLFMEGLADSARPFAKG
jgi:hypothetical protein